MKKTCRICHTRRAFVQCAFFHVPPSDISSRMIYCILSKNLVFLRCEHYEPLCEKPKKSRAQMTLNMFGMKKVYLQNVPSHDFSICYFLQMSFGFGTREPFHSEMYQISVYSFMSNLVALEVLSSFKCFLTNCTCKRRFIEVHYLATIQISR